jgi:hypothetical protein
MYVLVLAALSDMFYHRVSQTNRMNVGLPSDAVISQNEEASYEDLYSLNNPPPYDRY